MRPIRSTVSARSQIARIGLPVPPGFTITTEVCTFFYANKRTYPKELQTQIQKDQLRVSSKKKDELQEVIQALKQEDFGIPLQFTNYRP